MKRIFLLLFVLASLYTPAIFAQAPPPVLPSKDAQEAPYLQHRELPAFNIQLLDSATDFNTYDIPKGKPIVIMNFMPDCEHCQKLIEKLLKGMDTLKNIRFYLISPMEIADIRKFANKFHIDQYKNIVIGRDKNGFGPSFYMIRFVPFLALYDKNKNLVESFENSVEVKTLAAAAKKKGIPTTEKKALGR